MNGLGLGPMTVEQELDAWKQMYVLMKNDRDNERAAFQKYEEWLATEEPPYELKMHRDIFMNKLKEVREVW